MISAINIDHISLLSEAKWKVLKLFQTLLKEYQISALNRLHCNFQTQKIYESNDEELRRAMQKLCNNRGTVLDSESVKIIIRNEAIKASVLSYTFAFFLILIDLNIFRIVALNILVYDSNKMVEQTKIFSSSTTLLLPTQSSIASKRDSDEFNDNTNNRNSNKRLNHLKLGDIKGLSLNDKLEKL
ncbi:hypothetical protein BCV71DRAFT_237996 [Rhizopus microsporus]|uniref:Uncharacterized protein n=1 Tax=Rhizopus microsporus TaxID=58291 RepID=A0A1X0RS93_RHIZD|nr:hypothetical protein BCV71DRAFT_237996 [Rhizopus microsporus]